ncbi:MAG: hypothetical protein WBB19_16990 [Desulforhopalus sp.]
MEQLHPSLYFIVIASAFCVLAIIMFVMVKRENRLLSEQLTETTVSLELTRKKLNELQEKQENIVEFQNSLQVAELTTKLQKPRLNNQSFDSGTTTPEKYRFFQSLAQKGMSAEEIASILSISTHEAHQLLSLSKIAQGSFAANSPG